MGAEMGADTAKAASNNSNSNSNNGNSNNSKGATTAKGNMAMSSTTTTTVLSAVTGRLEPPAVAHQVSRDSVSSVASNASASSLRERFLQESKRPVRKPNVHIEDELDYIDKDHSVAHGHVAYDGTGSDDDSVSVTSHVAYSTRIPVPTSAARHKENGTSGLGLSGSGKQVGSLSNVAKANLHFQDYSGMSTASVGSTGSDAGRVFNPVSVGINGGETASGHESHESRDVVAEMEPLGGPLVSSTSAIASDSPQVFMPVKNVYSATGQTTPGSPASIASSSNASRTVGTPTGKKIRGRTRSVCVKSAGLPHFPPTTYDPNGPPNVSSPESKQMYHKRRGSHDENINGQPRKFLIDVQETQKMILEQEDTDGDFQITIHDQGPKSIQLGTVNSSGYNKYEIRGTYMLSNLLQELALANDYGRRFIVLDEQRLNENPVDRLNRLIKFHFWDNLTRRIDANGLEVICNDPKNRSTDQRHRIYIPYHDKDSWEYYTEVSENRPHLNLDVVRLPEIITAEYVQSLNERPGILSLALRKSIDVETGETHIRGTPFVVPGGRFNEMYGWDSYFETLGLIVDGRVELARGMVENFCYEIEHYGKILNANRSYYLARSQPPFLTDMINVVYGPLCERHPNIKFQKNWIAHGYRAAIRELFSIWMAPPRLDQVVGLSKYHAEGVGIPPETEVSHFDAVLNPFASKYNLSVPEYIKKYDNGEIIEPKLDEYLVHDRAVRESGHDTSYRLEGRCADLATIDLNSLVYRYQADIAEVIRKEFDGVLKTRVRKGPGNANLTGFIRWYDLLSERGVDGTVGNNGGWDSTWARGIIVMDPTIDSSISPKDQNYPERKVDRFGLKGVLPNYYTFEESYGEEQKDYFEVYFYPELFEFLSRRQRHLIDTYLWDGEKCLYFDYDCNKMERSDYESVTSTWAMWAGCASVDQAAAMVPMIVEKFEVIGGLVSGTEESRGLINMDRPNRQWDYPYGWAPHQILAWSGLFRYGYSDVARRFAYKWLYTITKASVDFNGVVPEKFDVVNLTHIVTVEYGNVGVDFKMVVREGFGWMNASYQIALTYMTKTMRRALGTVTSPQQLFDSNGLPRKSARAIELAKEEAVNAARNGVQLASGENKVAITSSPMGSESSLLDSNTIHGAPSPPGEPRPMK